MPRKQSSSRSRSDLPTSANPYAGMFGRTVDDKATFAEVMDGLLVAALDKIIDNGDALMISRTSDQGAIALSLYNGTHEPIKVYCVHQSELDEAITHLANW